LTLGRGKMSTLPTVFGLINRFDPKGLRVVIFAAFLGAIFDMAGVASVTPFLSIISNPGLIQENYYLSGLYEWFSFSETRDFIIFIGCATILFLVVVAVIRALIATRITLFIHWQRHNISFELFRNGFYAPLAIDGNEHSSLLTSRVFGETDVFIDSAVRPLIELMVHGLLLLMLLVMLLAVDLWNTLAILTGLAVFFGLIVIATRGPILRSGENRSRANVERYRSLKEALAGALELRLLGREDIYIARFFHASKMFARSVATNQAILQVATYAVQAFTFAGIIALTIGLIGQGKNLSLIVPILGLFAFAGYRIMPAANICYRAASTLRYAAPAIATIQSSLRETSEYPKPVSTSTPSEDGARITFNKEIRLENLSFSYGDNEASIEVEDVIFPVGKIIGIIGPSGSGKSTLFNLLLGLLPAQSGRIMIDDVALNADVMRRWHNSIGFVSQRPFFSDESIGSNIAIGLPEVKYDDASVLAAARMANAGEFIEKLPNGYATIMGEDGGRLSGGQRQRISIARALYHDPAVLFLDEVTSALDQASEKSVSDTIRELGGQKTVFVIAHRPAMLEICDLILELEAGRPVYYGSAAGALAKRQD